MAKSDEFLSLLRKYFAESEVEADPAVRSNYGTRQSFHPEWITVHYTGSAASRQSLGRFFKRKLRHPRSTHFLVDTDGISMVVPLTRAAWHIGGMSPKKKLPVCNSNSFGVDICEHKVDRSSLSIDDDDWYFDSCEVERAARLIAVLSWVYDIPLDHVVRHYDVTGKKCPLPMIGDRKFLYCIPDPLLKIDEETGTGIIGDELWKKFKLDMWLYRREIEGLYGKRQEADR